MENGLETNDRGRSHCFCHDFADHKSYAYCGTVGDDRNMWIMRSQLQVRAHAVTGLPTSPVAETQLDGMLRAEALC